MSHSVWAYTNNLPFFTFQPYSWILLCKGSCKSHILFDIPFTFPRMYFWCQNRKQDMGGSWACFCGVWKWSNLRWRTGMEMLPHATGACHAPPLLLMDGKLNIAFGVWLMIAFQEDGITPDTQFEWIWLPANWSGWHWIGHQQEGNLDAWWHCLFKCERHHIGALWRMYIHT